MTDLYRGYNILPEFRTKVGGATYTRVIMVPIKISEFRTKVEGATYTPTKIYCLNFLETSRMTLGLRRCQTYDMVELVR